MNTKNKEYKITFSSDYCEFERWAESDTFWKVEVESHPEELAICKKYEGKTIKLEDIPELIKEVGHSVVLSKNKCEIYNDYRE